MAQSGADFVPTARQAKVAEALANPEERRPKSEILKELRVPRRTFYNWMRNPGFVKYLSGVIDTYTDAELPEVWRQLMRQIRRGDTGAIKLYFEMKGKYRQQTELLAGGAPLEVNIKVVD